MTTLDADPASGPVHPLSSTSSLDSLLDVFDLKDDLKRVHTLWSTRRGFSIVLPLDGLLWALLMNGGGHYDVAFAVRAFALVALLDADVLQVNVAANGGPTKIGVHHCYHNVSRGWFAAAVGETETSVASLFDPEEEERMSLAGFSDVTNKTTNETPTSTTISVSHSRRGTPFTLGDDALGKVKGLVRKTVGVTISQPDWAIALCDHSQHYPSEDDEECTALEPVGPGFPFAAGFTSNLVAFTTLWEGQDRFHFLCGCCAADDVDMFRLAVNSDVQAGDEGCVHLSSNVGLNMLMVAAEFGAQRVMAWLLRYLPPLHLKKAHPVTGQLPLHYACRGGNSRVIELLLQHGADATAPSANAWLTPLHIACTQLNLPAIDLLLADGADVGAESKTGSTPLHCLCSAQGYVDLPLARRGAETVTTDVEAAQIAILMKLLEKVEQLDDLDPRRRVVEGEEGGIDGVLNAHTVHGLTALHIALRWDRVDLASQLIKLGADIKAKDVNGNRPLHMAVMYCRDSTVGPLLELLIEHGAKPTSKNCVGRTAVELAKEMEKQGELEAMKTLRRLASEKGNRDCVVS